MNKIGACGRRWQPAFLSCLLAFGAPAWSTPSWGEPDCRQWLQAQNTGARDWLLGYLSGMSIAWAAEGKTPARPLKALASVEEPFIWMDNFCRANPQEALGRAAVILFFELVVRTEAR